MYPLRYEPGGVLKRAGHTEAAVDLPELAGPYPAGVLAEIMNDDGTVARLPELERFAEEHGLLIGSIADLIAYRRREREARGTGRRGQDPAPITATSRLSDICRSSTIANTWPSSWVTWATGKRF